RLADACGAEEGEEMARAFRANALPRVVERPPLPLPADDRNVGAPRDLTGRREQRIRRNRFGLPLQLEPSLRPQLDGVADEADGARADQNLAWLRRLLEPRRDVDRIARGEPLLGACHDLAGVEADAAADAELRQRFAHLDRGAAGAERVVL